MKISTLRDDYYEASGKVSDLVRKLNFAGVGVIWIFKVGNGGGAMQFPHEVLCPLFLFVFSLGLDLCQYVYKSMYLGMMNTYLWRRYRNNEKDIRISGRWNWPTLAFFWLKTFLVIVAYTFLLKFLFVQLQSKP